MIVVLPDSKPVHNGSMYSSSVTTGDFETFIARDLVTYIDAHYRTVPNRDSRGLVGHSMGGYGGRIGMKHPEVFGSLYIMSPCCLWAAPAGRRSPRMRRRLRRSKPPRIRSSCLLFCVRSWRRRRPRRPTPTTRRFISTCRSGQPAGGVGKVGGECAAGVHRSIYYEPAAVPGDRFDVGDMDELKVARASCTTCWTSMASSSFEVYSGTHVAMSPYAFKTMCCPSSGGRCHSKRRNADARAAFVKSRQPTGGRMNLDRRSFAKSLTGVVGSLVAGQKVGRGVHQGHAGFAWRARRPGFHRRRSPRSASSTRRTTTGTGPRPSRKATWSSSSTPTPGSPASVRVDRRTRSATSPEASSARTRSIPR